MLLTKANCSLGKARRKGDVVMEATRSKPRALWLAALAVVMALATAVAFALPQKAVAADSLTPGEMQVQADGQGTQSGWIRLAGPIALDTMVAIVNQGWTTADTVVLTTVDGYWDALTAAGIAGQVNAPILMTDTATLNAQTKGLLASLKPTKIIVVGGPAAVSEDVAKAAAAATTVETKYVRVSGDDAIGTANDVAAKTAEYTSGTWADATAFVCTNDGYWDALAASPLAYALHYPIFLASGHDSITDETLKAMSDAGVKNVYIVGGKEALTADVNSQLQKAGFSTMRLEGKTAVETSEAVATMALDRGMSADNMGVATMEGYWDALTGAALCGKNGGVLVLANAKGDSDSISNFITKNKDNITTGFIFGGVDAISAGVEKAIKAAAPGVEKVTVTFSVDKTNFDYKFPEGYEQTEIDISTPEAQTIQKGATLNMLPEPIATVVIGKTEAGKDQTLDFLPEWYTNKDCTGEAVTAATTFDKDTTLYAKIVPAFLTVNLQSDADQAETGEYDQTVRFTQKQLEALKSTGEAVSATYGTNMVATSTSYVSLDDLFAAADNKVVAGSAAFATAWGNGECGLCVTASNGASSEFSVAEMKAGAFFPKYNATVGCSDEGKTLVAPALSLSVGSSDIGEASANAEEAQELNIKNQVAIGGENDKNPCLIVGMSEDQFKAVSTLASDKFVTNITTVTLQTPDVASNVTVAFDVNAPESAVVDRVTSQTIAKGGKVATKPNEQIDLTNMTCEGYTFLGWFAHATDPEGTTEEAIDLTTATFDQSTTLYARWKVQKEQE